MLENVQFTFADIESFFNTTSWQNIYSLTNYIDFMTSFGRCIFKEQDSKYYITVLGKLFLQYLKDNNMQIINKIPY